MLDFLFSSSITLIWLFVKSNLYYYLVIISVSSLISLIGSFVPPSFNIYSNVYLTIGSNLIGPIVTVAVP